MAGRARRQPLAPQENRCPSSLTALLTDFVEAQTSAALYRSRTRRSGSSRASNSSIRWTIALLLEPQPSHLAHPERARKLACPLLCSFELSRKFRLAPFEPHEFDRELVQVRKLVTAIKLSFSARHAESFTQAAAKRHLTRRALAADNDHMTLRIAKTVTALGFVAALAALFGRRPA